MKIETDIAVDARPCPDGCCFLIEVKDRNKNPLPLVGVYSVLREILAHMAQDIPDDAVMPEIKLQKEKKSDSLQ